MSNVVSLEFRRLKSFKITALIPFASLLFTAGFAMRVYGAWNYDNLITFLASTALIYMSPYVKEHRLRFWRRPSHK